MSPLRGPSSPRTSTLACLLLSSLVIASCGPSDPVAAVRAQQAVGDYQGSIEPLRELLRERPGESEVQYLYGLALGVTGQHSLAEWPLREAMKDPEWLVPAGIQFIHGSLVTRNLSQAIEAANRVLEVEPENLDVLVMRANAYAHGRIEPERALEEAERIFELEPGNMEAWEPKILALLALDRIEEAETAIDEMGERIREESDDSDLSGWHCATAALFAQESEEHELAAERWADCTERFPAHSNVISNAVNYYDGLSQFDRSLEIMRRGYELSPEARDRRVFLTERLRLAGEAEEAEALLLEATETELIPMQAAAWLDLLKHYQAVEDYAAGADAAEKAYALAVEFGEPNPQIELEYADALVIAGRLDEAEAFAAKLSLPAHREMVLARIAQQRGRPAEALEHFDKGFVLWPDNAFARYYAALAAESVGDFDRAVEAYRYAIRIAPNATDARIRVARLHMAEGKLGEAVHLLRLSAEDHPLSFEGEMLSLHLWARAGREGLVRRGLGMIQEGLPQALGTGIAHAARGLRERLGPRGATLWLRRLQEEGLDFTHPAEADALRALVELSEEAGGVAEAEPDVKAAVAAHPEDAVLKEIHALWLERVGGREAEARTAYEEVLGVAPASVTALTGLGRLTASEDPERALELFGRAAEADTTDLEALRAAAELLVASGRASEAMARLDTLLERHPYDAEAAARLATLQLEAGDSGDRCLGLAERAARFGGGPDALELLGRVHSARNEPELAQQAEARARNLRERLRDGPAAPPDERPAG